MSTISSSCAPLLEACTPQLYAKNGFRITGLEVDATTRQVKRRIDDLKMAHEDGELEGEAVGAFALWPAPTWEMIQEGNRRLQDPEYRLLDEFFWFWPMKRGESDNDPGLVALKQNNKQKAFEYWVEIENNDHGERGSAARHNLAVMYHLAGIDFDLKAMDRHPSKETLNKLASYWRAALQRWETLTDDEVFWRMVGDRIRELDDPRLTPEFARAMRATFPEALDKINGELALSYAEKGKYEFAGEHVAYMKQSHQGRDNVTKTLRDIAAPVLARIQAFTQNALDEFRKEAKAGGQAALRLLEETAPPLRVVSAIFEAGHPERTDAFEGVAEACLQCAIGYGNVTEDWPTCEQVLVQIYPYAMSQDLKKRLETNLETVSGNKSYRTTLVPFIDLLKEIENRRTSASAKVEEFKRRARPQLTQIAQTYGNTNSVYTRCCDEAAGFLAKIAIQALQERNVQLARSTLQDALFLVNDDRLRQQIDEGLEALEKQMQLVGQPFGGGGTTASPTEQADNAKGCLGCLAVVGIIALISVLVNNSGSSPSPSPGPGVTTSRADRSDAVSAEQRQRLMQSLAATLAERQQGQAAEQTPQHVAEDPEEAPLVESELPQNGWTKREFSGFGSVPLEIQAIPRHTNYLVRIEESISRKPVASILVRGDRNVKTKLPPGIYSVEYSWGNVWFGEDAGFGPDAPRKQMEETLHFQDSGQLVSGWDMVLGEGDTEAYTVTRKSRVMR